MDRREALKLFMAATLPIGGLFTADQREFDYEGFHFKVSDYKYNGVLLITASKKINGKPHHIGMLIDDREDINDVKQKLLPHLKRSEQRILRTRC
jgi:hypothetical protein